MGGKSPNHKAKRPEVTRGTRLSLAAAATLLLPLLAGCSSYSWNSSAAPRPAAVAPTAQIQAPNQVPGQMPVQTTQAQVQMQAPAQPQTQFQGQIQGQNQLPAAQAVPAAPPPLDEHDQALADAYPSESVIDLLRRPRNPPPQAAQPVAPQAAPGVAVAPGAPTPLTGNAMQSTGVPSQVPGPAPYGAAPNTAAPPAAVAAQQESEDRDYSTDSYPSDSLSNLLSGKGSSH